MAQQSKHRSISELVKFTQEYIANRIGCSKQEVSEAVAKEFGLRKERSVYFCADFAVRFSSASGLSFSNVVLSLSALHKYDSIPFVVCVVRVNEVEFFLANSSLLKKISHSSHQLRIDNVRGSFLGHDIMRECGGIVNIPSNFDKLFSMHRAFSWEENLARLVEATGNIAPTGTRFTPSNEDCARVLSSADLAHSISQSAEYFGLGKHLTEIALQNASQILETARIDNINVRGNKIEQIITKTTNVHGLEDLTFKLEIGTRVLVDVKTKILTLMSSPKGYNIDKFLATLATGSTVFAFFFVGIDLHNHTLVTRLVSVLDRTILNATRIQFHWAGRHSRGVTQLTGDLTPIFENGFQELIEPEKAKGFLQRLIDL